MTATPSPTTLPAAPLLRQVELAGGPTALGVEQGSSLERAIDRARRCGVLSIDAADRLSVRVLRMHPIEIWGDAFLPRLGDTA